LHREIQIKTPPKKHKRHKRELTSDIVVCS
jgi:hypothetical protein